MITVQKRWELGKATTSMSWESSTQSWEKATSLQDTGATDSELGTQTDSTTFLKPKNSFTTCSRNQKGIDGPVNLQTETSTRRSTTLSRTGNGDFSPSPSYPVLKQTPTIASYEPRRIFPPAILRNNIKEHEWRLREDPTDDYKHLCENMLNCAKSAARPSSSFHPVSTREPQPLENDEKSERRPQLYPPGEDDHQQSILYFLVNLQY
ncbi:unnamed protein product [Caenorhabditis auriculariae]|uniref:Uncharacterized protein n=1 Tax=Caenorhabditis auriculariae TaxID=2777116 RepID=A0A8S1HG43_9PELO|nr:unnamed protein product [Caenorhabditis auriculariae]